MRTFPVAIVLSMPLLYSSLSIGGTATPICTAEPEVVTFLDIDSSRSCPGFYITRVTGDIGYWSMEVGLTENLRLLQGGLNLGVGFTGADQAGFAAFNIANGASEPQIVSGEIVFAEPNPAGNQIEVVRRFAGQREIVFQTSTPDARVIFESTLNPGFHSIRVFSSDGAAGSAQIALSTRFIDRVGGAFQGGVNFGGRLDSNDASSFASFCISDPQDVRFTTFGVSQFPAQGVHQLQLTVLDRDRNIVEQTCDDPPPAAPRNLQATSSLGEVSLAWDENPENDIQGYDVFRGISPGGPYTRLTEPGLTDPSYVDRNIDDQKSYYYVVTAFDNTGSSERSSEVPALGVTVPRFMFEVCSSGPFGGGCNSRSLPYGSSATVQTTVVGSRPSTYEIASFRIKPLDAPTRVVNLSVSDSRSSTDAFFEGLHDGQSIAQGETVSFSINSEWTGNVTENLRFRFGLEGQGQVFDYQVQLRTN